MQKIKEIYTNWVDKLSANMTRKKMLKIMSFLVVLALVIAISANKGGQTNKSELAVLLESGKSYIQQSQTLQSDYLAKKVDGAEYSTKVSEIEKQVEELNIKLHEIELSGNVNLDKENVGSTGDAIQILVYLIFHGDNFKNLNDEILALNIIIDEIIEKI